MKCSNCGADVNEGKRFCADCGSEVIQGNPQGGYGIKCYISGCTNAVSGQCPGLPEEPCGHFYCNEHSENKLCDECNVVKEIRLLYNEYCQIAFNVRNVKRDNLIAAMLMFLLIPTIILCSMYSTALWLIPYFTIVALVIFLILQRKKKRYIEACEQYEGFEDFYYEYRKAARKESLHAALGQTTDIVLGAMGETLAERDLRHIRNRVENM